MAERWPEIARLVEERNSGLNYALETSLVVLFVEGLLIRPENDRPIWIETHEAGVDD